MVFVHSSHCPSRPDFFLLNTALSISCHLYITHFLFCHLTGSVYCHYFEMQIQLCFLVWCGTPNSSDPPALTSRVADTAIPSVLTFKGNLSIILSDRSAFQPSVNFSSFFIFLVWLVRLRILELYFLSLTLQHIFVYNPPHVLEIQIISKFHPEAKFLLSLSMYQRFFSFKVRFWIRNHILRLWCIFRKGLAFHLQCVHFYYQFS